MIGLHSQNDGFSFGPEIDKSTRNFVFCGYGPYHMVRPVIRKPEKVKNQLLDDHTIVQSAFHGFPDTLKLKQEYLTRLAFFSSNSCLFASETDLRKNSSCPLGQFRCGKDGSNTLGIENLEFSDAKKSCVNKSAQLSKFYDT